MNHPVILAVPVLMLLDYLLTILGAKASLGVYRQHFTAPHYELNPFWQKSVRQLRWFNPRLFIIVCIVTALLVLLERRQNSPDLVAGMLLGVYGSVFGRHLNNLLLFHYLNRHPAEIGGHVHVTHTLALKMSLFNCIGLVPLLGLIAVLVPQPQTIGAFLGILVAAFAHLVWTRKAKSQEVTALVPADAHAHSGAVHPARRHSPRHRLVSKPRPAPKRRVPHRPHAVENRDDGF